jgi:hypothetical protein
LSDFSHFLRRKQIILYAVSPFEALNTGDDDKKLMEQISKRRSCMKDAQVTQDFCKWQPV